MTNRSLFFAMILSSLIGGVVAIGGYALLLDEKQAPVLPVSQSNPAAFTNYVVDTATSIVPEGLNFVHAANSATASVVHIKTTYSGIREGVTSPMDEFLREYFGDTPGRQRGPSQGAGSGVIVSPNGYIVTNNHVVDDATEIEVLLNDNRSFKADVIGLDPTTDLAVLKIKADNLPSMKWGNSEQLQLGEWVLAVGNPFEFRSTVTAGIVSAKARNIGILARQNDNLQIESFIQTDAAVNPGNSGGALVNLRGELVGLNTAIISPTGAFAGYSFAVPVSLVQKVYNDLVEFGAVQRALLGIEIRDVNSELAKQENLDVVKGVYVIRIRNGSAAEEAGLEEGDVITAVDGKIVNSTSELQERVALNRPGDKISVTFLRNGKSKTATAILKNTAGTTDVVEVASSSISISGSTFVELTDAEKDKLNLDGGVKVETVGNGKWKEAGLKPGYIITRVDKKEIRDVSNFSGYLQSVQGEGILLEGIYPNGDKAYYGIGW